MRRLMGKALMQERTGRESILSKGNVMSKRHGHMQGEARDRARDVAGTLPHVSLTAQC